MLHRSLTLNEAVITYCRTHVQLKRDIEAGRIPGYKVGKRWYVAPVEVAFKGVIEKYNRLAAESTPVVGMREVATIIGIPYGTFKRWIHEGRFPRGQQIKPYANSRMFWDVRALRKALRKHEGKSGKEQYSETIFQWMKRELDRNPALEPRPASNLIVTLKQIMNLPIDERQKELASFYNVMDDVASELSKKN